jgi:hypothetical protein
MRFKIVISVIGIFISTIDIISSIDMIISPLVSSDENVSLLKVSYFSHFQMDISPIHWYSLFPKVGLRIFIICFAPKVAILKISRDKQ